MSVVQELTNLVYCIYNIYNNNNNNNPTPVTPPTPTCNTCSVGRDIYNVFKMLETNIKENFTIGINDDLNNQPLSETEELKKRVAQLEAMVQSLLEEKQS